MQVKEIVVRYSRANSEFHKYPLGDMHFGTKHALEHELIKKVKVIKDDPTASWIGMGDYGDFILPGDPRWEYDRDVFAEWLEQDNIADSQIDSIAEILRPIVDKCDGLLEGNHEWAISHHFHQNVIGKLCKQLGVDYLGYSCFVRYIFRRANGESHQIIGHYEHGSGNCITKGAKLNKLRRSMDAFEADIYGYAHMHDIITDTKPYLTMDKRNHIWSAKKVGAVTGSWVTAYTQGLSPSYAERKGYPPNSIGCPTFIIDPNEGRLEVQGG